MSDWRKSAYLRKENWPQCIPWTGPKRRYGPDPWWHETATEIDQYPSFHPDAGSIGETFLGDVCPWCGVPLDFVHDEIVLADGTRGLFHSISDIEEPERAYHPTCWMQRRGYVNTSLSDYE